MGRSVENSTCDEKVYNELFRVHSKDLYNFLYYKYGEEFNPKDLVQEAFVKLWNNCHKVLPEKARSFLFTVASNQALNEISKYKTVLKYRKEEIHKNYTQESPEFILEENEYMNRLQKAIENLPEGQRTAFLLNRIEGKKHKEIAEMLNISQKAVEKRIYTALASIRKIVDEIK